jgi:death-on-curing protein
MAALPAFVMPVRSKAPWRVLTTNHNKWVYGEGDRCALAAAYAYGIARNHPFSDGNKRTAWVLARLFLRLNGLAITFTPKEAIDTVLALAAGELPEDELAGWFRDHLTRD